ncbi:hypothetical protein GCM10017083_20800 [Thalassobaculum fulvum]|uniref:B3/B4 tRNA-binding domain-containing protein n=1 Tax=Thalassobaculum fulvum TaxID=1633335 RepID=A0A918XR65_9PROT|nr:phenylalanine--tRNA ligase beta subunit-related protein [Thalassobaculum fulvum]GHD49016.1 hypothetical protein GCM10017083_20800 [Thalassobaculum fulvum]
MQFSHSSALWGEFPELAAGALVARGIAPGGSVDAAVARYEVAAQARLAGSAEGGLPEIQAWRRAFSRMGLKPTQYRCASEALLRRFRKEAALPRIHPMIDLCNAASMAFAIPVAVFDIGRIAGGLEVRHAVGDEVYETFSGEVEHPAAGEVVFADREGRAHARRWTNRQSGYSAVRADTTDVLIVAEALHDTAAADVPRLLEALSGDIGAAWSVPVTAAMLSASAPAFAF